MRLWSWPKLKPLSGRDPGINAVVFVPSTKHVHPMLKVFISSTMNSFIFYLEGGLENLWKEQKLAEIFFWKTLFQLRMGLKKHRNRDKRMQKDYPTSDVHFCRCWVVFLHCFISALFVHPFQPNPYLKWSVTETFFLVLVSIINTKVLILGHLITCFVKRSFAN